VITMVEVVTRQCWVGLGTSREFWVEVTSMDITFVFSGPPEKDLWAEFNSFKAETRILL
jgi:hypothetical protein